MLSEAAQRVLLIVPGFLTQKGLIGRELEGSPLESIDPTRALDGRAWLNAVTSIVQEDVHVEVFEWESMSVEAILIRILLLKSRPDGLTSSRGALDPKWLRMAQEVFERWMSVFQECENVTDQLRHKISGYPPSTQLYIMGHSLGGRLVLNAAQSMPQSQISSIKMSAWAPAMYQDEFDWDRGARLPFPPEIIFSRHDYILKFLFPLGQGSLGREPWKSRLFNHLKRAFHHTLTTSPIGLSGPPISSPYPASRDLTSQKVGHLSYLHAVPDLFRKSVYLSELCRSLPRRGTLESRSTPSE